MNNQGHGLVSAWPVGHFIKEEMDARGWTQEDLARRLGDPFDVAMCTLELILHVHDPRVLLGVKTAQALGEAFGVSADLFLNLDKSWREWAKKNPHRLIESDETH